MHNVFLYSASDSVNYRHVEEYLKTLSFVRLIVLPPGSKFTSPLCLHLRSNDLIILFANDNEEINELLSLRDEFDSFKILLILKNEKQTKENNYIHLSPRFISYLDNTIEDVSEYLHSIFKI